MPTRRTVVLLLIAVCAALPAFILRLTCVGAACGDPVEAGPRIPFCSLPSGTRALIAAGYRDGPSPEIVAVARRHVIARVPTRGALEVSLPTLLPPSAVPIHLAGTGIASDATIPSGTGLDDIAATLARVLGLRRPHPEVRTGTAVDGIATGEVPRLVLMVVFKGLDPRDLGGLDRVLDGPSTDGASVGSVPLDPAAVLTTIGTGGLPFQHGITGTLMRDERGRLVRAWGQRVRRSVIATLADDLDERLRQRPRIGLVATDRSDRGLTGGDWYVGVDRDDLSISDDPGAAVRRLLATGYGEDRVPDLLAVTVQDDREAPEKVVEDILRAAERVSSGSVAIAVTATGAAAPTGASERAGTLTEGVRRSLGADVIEAVTPSGIFVDQVAVAKEDISQDAVVDAVRSLAGEDGEQLMADVFPGIAVSFARYC